MINWVEIRMGTQYSGILGENNCIFVPYTEKMNHFKEAKITFSGDLKQNLYPYTFLHSIQATMIKYANGWIVLYKCKVKKNKKLKDCYSSDCIFAFILIDLYAQTGKSSLKNDILTQPFALKKPDRQPNVDFISFFSESIVHPVK